MPERRIAVILPEELYQKSLRHSDKSAFVREALQANAARRAQRDMALQMRDHCARESESDRMLCSELDKGTSDGSAAQR